MLEMVSPGGGARRRRARRVALVGPGPTARPERPADHRGYPPSRSPGGVRVRAADESEPRCLGQGEPALSASLLTGPGNQSLLEQPHDLPLSARDAGAPELSS